MSKYEVYVSTPNRNREMFRINVTDLEELFEEINSRYTNITECTIHDITPGTLLNTRIRLNLKEGKVVPWPITTVMSEP